VVDDVEERMLSGLTPAEAAAFGRALERCLDALTVPVGESTDDEGAA
jgi:hypothetical protein